MDSSIKKNGQWLIENLLLYPAQFFLMYEWYQLPEISWARKGIPCSSSKSRNRSTLLRGTPAFSIAVTTFTRYTRVESGKPSPTNQIRLSYTCRAFWILDSSLLTNASFYFPLMCFWDLIWYSIELFFKVNTSLQARQNNLLLLTINSSFGYDFTRSHAEIRFGSPFSFPLPVLTPLGGGFCLSCLFLDKSAGVGDLRQSSKEITVGEPDSSDSEIDWSMLSLTSSLSVQDSSLLETSNAPSLSSAICMFRSGYTHNGR